MTSGERLLAGILLAVLAMGLGVGFIAAHRAPRDVPATVVEAPPTAVAQKVTTLLDQQPGQWEDGIFGIDNPKYHISIYTGQTSLGDTKPEDITVKIDGAEMPGFKHADEKDHSPTVSQKLVYGAFVRWTNETSAAQLAEKQAKQSAAIEHFMKEPL